MRKRKQSERKNLRNTISSARRRVLAGAAATLAVPFLARSTFAQSAWPAHSVRVIIPYPPAGGADTVGRIYFAKLSEVWGQQFAIDNRGGAGGTIAETAAAKADPDGYTVLYDATAFSVNPFLYPKLPFDYVKDFQPVFLASLVPNILVVNKSVEAKTVADVIAMAKAAPDGLDFASSGNGTVQHLSLEMFRHVTGTKIHHIPYRGGGPALNDVIGGQVKFFFSNGSASIGHVEAGTVKAIAHTGRGRLRTMPDLPAVSDTIPGFEAYEWNGVFVPVRTPQDIVQKLNAGLNAMLKEPAVTDRLDKLNVDYRANTPEEFRAFVAAEMEKWSRVVKEANIKLG
jgi:tripartite-type tricarboxylate transporter receptor subunit TctC